MDNCNIFDFHIENDSDNRLKNFVKDAIESQEERIIIADKINNGKLQQWAINHKIIKDASEIRTLNGNTFKKLVVDYMNAIRPSVTRSTMRRQNQSIGNFTSNQARTDALTYTGNLIRRAFYQASYSKDESLRKKDKSKVLNDVRNEVINNFFERAKIFLKDNVNTSEVKAIIPQLKEIGAEIKSTKESNIPNQRKTQKINDLQKKRFELLYDAIIKVNKGNIAFTNYAELTKNVYDVNSFNQWFTEVKSLTSMFTITKEFDGIKLDKNAPRIENNTQYEANPNEDVSSTGEDDYMDTINSQTASWDDARLRDFSKHFESRLKLYLSLIPERSASIVGKDNKDNFKHNDTLGVPTYMDPNYIMNQIMSMGPFNSLQHFYDTLADKAKTIPSLYGLGQLLNDMKNDLAFANFVFSQFNKPIIAAIQIQLAQDTTSVIIGNSEAFASTKATADLISDSNMVGREEYEASDVIQLRKYRNAKFNDSDIRDKNDSDRNKLKDYLVSYLSKHFPSIDRERFIDYYFDNAETATADKINTLLDALISYNNGLGTALKNQADYNKEYFKTDNEYNKIKNASTPDNPITISKPVYDESKINRKLRNEACIKLAKILGPVLNNFVRLNSTNAEGAMSSSVIKNSYVTNFLKQLKLDIDNGNTGQEIIKEFFTRKAYDITDNETNMFLFGLKDRNGKTIRRGLFTKNINGEYIIDKDSQVAKMFGLGLFDGIRSLSDNEGIVYSDMTREDYLLSSMRLANTGLTYEGIRSDETKGYGNFLMRIPSDASNTYMIQMKKFNIETLYDWGNARQIISASIGEKIGQLEDLFNVENLGNDDTSHKEIVRKTNAAVRGRLKSRNYIDANTMMNLLYNGYIEDLIIDKNYEQYKSKGEVFVPLIYEDKTETEKKEDKKSFVVWVKGKVAKNGQLIERATIQDIRSIVKAPVNNDFGFSLSLGEEEYDDTTSIRYIIQNFLDTNRTFIRNRLYSQGVIKRSYNKNSEVFLAFRNELWGELQNFATQLNNVFERDSKGNYISKTSTDNLFEVLHYDGSIVKDGKLTGQEFLFKKLFNVGFDANSAIYKLLGIYDAKDSSFSKSFFKVRKDGRLQINFRDNDIFRLVDANGKKGIITVGNDFDSSMNQTISEGIDNIVSDWLDTYMTYISNSRSQFETILDAADNLDFTDYMINTTLAYMMYDSIFEGSSKFYKDPKTFLKRAKETQMGGTSFAAFDFNQYIGNNIETVKDINGQDAVISIKDRGGNELIKTIPTYTGNGISDNPFVLRTGFRAITVKNTKSKYKEAKRVWETVYKSALKGVKNEESAKKIADQIAAGYGYGEKGATTKVNDAQSYITLEEFIRRKFADGTLEEYMPLLQQLLDPNIKPEDIDYELVAKKIQPQKNVYYDLQFDPITGKHYPRQIKNAEFVLIPKLLEKRYEEDDDKGHKKGELLPMEEQSSLYQLYYMMKENDIGQVNTVETSKAANKNVLTYWDNDGKANMDLLKSSLTGDVVETYYYKNLYKQQDVVDHIGDTENKAGIQLIKKIMDNASSYGKKVSDATDIIQAAMAANIKDSYNQLIRELGWKTNEDGDIVNKDGSTLLKFDNFYKKCLEEFQRTGSDSNITDYLTPDKTGIPIMPEWMSVVATKLENIAQSVFNNNITRQLLPGYHGTQVTNVGYSSDLKYHPVGEDGNQYPVVEVRLPAYHPAIKALIKKYGKEEALRRLNEAGLTTHIGYRIPTEGKQSIAVIKVVDFLDEAYGSTIIVADEWVTQTGSDFDVDSIYSVIYELEFDGENVKKIEYDLTDSEEATDKRFIYQLRKRVENNNEYLAAFNNIEKENNFDAFIELGKKVGLNYEEFASRPIMEQLTREQRNNVICDNMVAIMSDEAVMEEVYGRSNFDDITAAKNEMEEISGNTLKDASVYNPLDQLKFMQNAIDGRKLKAFSVNRDTFTSINNRVRTQLSQKNAIRVVYDAEYYDENIIAGAYDNYNKIDTNIIVNHRQFGWSNNNRNVVGRLITSYSSETTAHILDAIKEGALINETDYTFGTFKTLVDLGIDYRTAISWLMQPAISRLNAIKNSTNSIYIGGKINPVYQAVVDIYTELGFNDNTNKYPTYKEMFEKLRKDDDYQRILKDVFFEDENGKTAINGKALIKRLENEKKYKETGEPISRDDLIFDLITVLQFDTYHKLTDKIENVAQVLRPDSFGAKQIIRDTRTIIEKIDKYRKKDGNILIAEDGRNIINAVYTEDNSRYEYLNAFYKYATLASVNINTKLFDTERGNFLLLTKEIETRIGKTLTDEQYQDAKKYLVHSVYQGVPLLYSPIRLDDSRFVTIDKEAIENGNVAYWDTETGRIYGLKETEKNNPDINFENPSKEDIDTFAKLTPAQKVLYIKTHFTDINYFNKLDVVKAFRNELTSKHYSYNRIFVADTTFDMDTLRQEFLNAFMNKNPLVRMAAIDLVKYSFVVEGFDFRKGSISKTIPNVVLYSDVQQGGMGIVSQAKESFQNLDVPGYEVQYFTDNFIRSHSYIIEKTSIKTKNKDTVLHNKLLKCYDKSNGLIAIPKIEAFEDLIDRVKQKRKTSNYVKLEHSAAGGRQTILYKVVDNLFLDKIYLVPINYLEEFENSEWSVNNANNRWQSYNYYIAIIQQHITANQDIFELDENDKLVVISDNEAEVNAFLEQRDMTLQEIAARTSEIPVYKFSSHPDEYKLINAYKQDKPAQNAQLSKFFNDIKEIIDENNSEIKTMVVENSSDVIEGLLALGKQRKSFYIPYEDTTVKVSIQRYYPNKIKQYQSERGLPAKELTNDIQFYSKRFGKIEDWQKFYSIEIEVDNSTLQNIEDNDARDSKYTSYDAAYNASFTGDENHTLSVLIAKDLKFQAIHDDEDAMHTLSSFSLNGIHASSAQSLNEKKTSVYAIANKYYKKAYDSLNAEMNNFTLSNGQVYKISDPELYKNLTPDDAQRLINLVLKAQNFGDSLREFTDFDVIGEDAETQQEVETLKNYVNSIRNSNLLKSAFDHIFNIYISKEYSRNPHIKVGLIDATTLFGDTSRFTAAISDIGHIPHKQIQMVVKAIGDSLSAAEYEGRQKVQDFDDWIKNNIGDNPNEVFNKIIDKDGRIIQPYTDKFIEDKIKFRDELREIAQTKGYGGREYIEKRLAYDKWLYKNTEQLIVPDYYKQNIEIRERALRLGGDRFIKYKEITTELNSVYRDTYNLTPAEQEERGKLIDALYELLNKETEDGKMKPASELNEIEAIEKYREDNAKLNQEYFEYNETEQFKKNLQYNLDIIKRYDAEHKTESIQQKLNNLEYRIAYNWIRSNTRYKLNKEAQKALEDAYKALSLGPVQRSNQNGVRQIYAKHRNDGTLYDVYGQVIGSNFTDDEIKTIHDIEQAKYSPVEGDMSQFSADGTLIKNVPRTPMLTQDFWIKYYIGDNEKNPEVVALKRELFTKINTIISKGINKDKYSQNRGVVEARRLFDNCTQEELEDLADYYRQLRLLTSGRKEKKGPKLFDYKYNEVEFAKQQAIYKTLNRTEKNLFQEIFCECDATGALVTDDDGKAVPNGFIYGYAELKPEVAKAHPEFFDTKRENARKLIEDNIEFVPTEYYFEAQNKNAAEAQQLYDEAIAAGKSQKEAAHIRDSHIDSWFDNNHVWNMREGRWQPIQIWTVRRIKENGTLPGTYGFEPIGDNFERDVKEDKKNNNYSTFGNNYKPSTGSYNNSQYGQLLSNPESKEYKLWNYITNLMNQAATNNSNRRFIEQGFAPRQYKAVTDTEYWIKQGLAAVGLNFRNYNNQHWTENVDYAHDHEVNNPMMEILKTKGYEALEKIPAQEPGQSDEDYRQIVSEINKRNREREKTNLELEKAVRDENWNTVFRNFIYKSTIYREREKAKNLAYLTIEDLKSRKAYSITGFGNLSKTSMSTEGNPDYNMVDQQNTLGIFQNWIRRVIFGEYKKLGKLNKYADTLQNMASAKYMMFNLYAGINNVTVGLSNIMGETFAKTYFDGKDYLEAVNIYRSSMFTFMKDMFSDTTNDLTCGILKLFDAIEIDKMLDFANKGDFDLAEIPAKFNTIAYSMQSGGEHFMQNTALIAMLKSHRIYVDNDGKRVIGSFEEYTQNIEDAALQRVLSCNEYLSSKYHLMKQKAKADKQLQYEYDKLKRNVINDFLNTLTDEEKSQYGEQYIKLRNEMLKNDKAEFEALPNVWDQFELHNGIARFKPESGLTDADFGMMRHRAIYVNKKIHGVYDKNGAAQMEKYWFGSLIMQFKKHVYPGIMKRWRTAGYYNEIRGSFEKGSYISVLDFLGTEFKDFKTKMNTKKEDGSATALAAIQTLIKCVYDTATNFKFNYDILPKWERDNINRALADLCSTMAALLTTFAIYALADDDDLEENTFLNSTLYLADRLYGESRMYTPFGAVPEIQTQWSQPVAGQGVFKDLYDACSFSVQWLFNPDYDPIYRSGTYKGKNKVKVKVLKNIPAVRTVQRIKTINSSNKYYRIGDNQTAQKIVKQLAFEISGKNENN